MILSTVGDAWSRGGLLPGGCLVLGELPGPGGSAPGGAACWRPPGWLLLRAVRILLECILVIIFMKSIFHSTKCCLHCSKVTFYIRRSIEVVIQNNRNVIIIFSTLWLFCTYSFLQECKFLLNLVTNGEGNLAKFATM